MSDLELSVNSRLPADGEDGARLDLPVELDDGEAARLKDIMDRTGFVTLFVSEGACMDEIVADREAAGEEIKRDAFGHVKLDTINVGNWFQKHFAKLLDADRSMVQKSGYYARSAPANYDDLRLIQSMVDLAVESGLNKVSGVTGHDEDQGGRLRTIEFPRIKGGKPFDIDLPWFGDLLGGIDQPKGSKVEAH